MERSLLLYKKLAAHLGKIIFLVCFGYLLLVVCVQALWNFSWEFSGDVAFINYLSWLSVDREYTPYLDFIETSFPGTFIFHGILIGFFGTEDVVWHLIDVLILIVLLAITWFLLKPIHPLVAASAMVFFALYYLDSYAELHLQRDYLLILFVASSLLGMQYLDKSPVVMWVFIGLFFSMAASIKPHAVIGLPVVWLCSCFLLKKDYELKSSVSIFIKSIACVMAGFLFWFLICTGWLFYKGSQNAFVSMIINYLPIYMETENYNWHDLLVFISDIFKDPVHFFQLNTLEINPITSYLASLGFAEGKFLYLWILAGPAWAIFFCRENRKNILTISALLGLSIAYIGYVGLGGKGWSYHWMPARYFGIICACFLLCPAYSSNLKVVAWIRPLCIIGFVLFFFKFNFSISPYDLHLKAGLVKADFFEYPRRDQAKIDLLSYLENKVKPGQKIGFFTSGTYGPFFSAALKLQLSMAARYPFQDFLYSNGDNPYVMKEREKFLSQLGEKPLAQYLIGYEGQFGPGYSGNVDKFTEFSSFIENRYHPLHVPQLSQHHFVIYERNELYGNIQK